MPDKTTEKAGDTTTSSQIPNVPSTSLGLFEEADEKDPNKWKKFAWKYVGALVVFMISYKTLHWYVDRLAADAKRRREEVEENKQIAQELRSSSPANSAPTLANPSSEEPSFTPVAELDPNASPTAGGGADSDTGDPTFASLANGEDGSPNTPLEFLEQINSKIPVASSELDELRAYRLELQGRISELNGLDNSHVELPDLKEELIGLDEEINMIESKK